uniref:Serine/threonine-protein kinase ATR n=1 Tax=Crypthecodinium cohnii TaxID=2866 RepID=A0A516AGR8_CRYCO|nr:serine/threonine-protein kinase ATR [Crypthecodinium cohnii]
MALLGKFHPRARLLHARWATAADSNLLVPRVAEEEFLAVQAALPDSEAPFFHHAAYLDRLLCEQMEAKRKNSQEEGKTTSGGSTSSKTFDPAKLATFTIGGYLQALRRGNKRVHFILNRVLQVLWDCSELDWHKAEVMAEFGARSNALPPWVWYMVLPQLVSRVHHPDMSPLFLQLIQRVLVAHPHQAIWHVAHVRRSADKQRKEAGSNIQAGAARQDKHLHRTMVLYEKVMQGLARLAAINVPDGRTKLMLGTNGTEPLVGNFRILIPLQSLMTATAPRLQSLSDMQSPLNPFPDTIFAKTCLPEAEVYRSKEKPKKLVFVGEDGQHYPFLCKMERKGDLRKDGRMMMFGCMLNQLLEQSSAARKRNLQLVTFNVVILEEKCGLIEWVSNTKGMRHLIDDLWKKLRPGQQQMVRDIKTILDNSKDLHETFTKQILKRHPPIFHHWFTQIAPDPSVWLSYRTTFCRSQALWCMLGYIVGLGDRHGENILVDTSTGRVVHVDFDCLFCRGMQLERPETVPFRLTQNCVSALGVTGIEGSFRESCQVSMGVMRDKHNKETLRSVLQVYIADPLIEWQRLLPGKGQGETDPSAATQAARTHIGDIAKKLDGMVNVGPGLQGGSQPEALSVLSTALRQRGLLGVDRGVGLSVNGQVDELLKAAMCKRNLAAMYVGWQPWV